MAPGQAGGRGHAQADVVSDEDLSAGGSGVVGGATSQDSQRRCRVSAGRGGERRGHNSCGRGGGGVGGGLQEGRDRRGGGECRLIDLVKAGDGGQVMAFMST